MPNRTPEWRIAVGLLASLLLHAAALLFLRLPEPKVVADVRGWMTRVEVRIVAPPPPSPDAAEPEDKPEPKPQAAARAFVAKPASSRTRPGPRQSESKLAEEGTLIQRPAEEGGGQPFDREAAKAAAREIAAELDPSPPRYRETRDEQLARQIQRAARPDCKDGIPGGLLAPLYLMMEKKGTGCKW